MNDDALIKAQDNILHFLMDGPKGRNDFWNDTRFKKLESDQRGIYPKKILHIMENAFLLEKFKEKNRVKWRIVDGAFFRMGDKEYNWNSEDQDTFEDSVDESVGNVMEEIEADDFPYLKKAKEALNEKPKSWLQKLSKMF